MSKMWYHDDKNHVNWNYCYEINYDLINSDPMTKKGKKSFDLKNLEILHRKLIKRITPDIKLKCVAYYNEQFDENNLESNKDLDCNILEIISDSSIDIENFKTLIKEAEYRILEMTYDQDHFHFLVQKSE